MHEALEGASQAALSVPRVWARALPADQLRTLRASRGISQRYLAELSGVDQSVISRLERGADARWETWRRLFAALGFDAVLAPLPSSEDAEGLLQDGTYRRAERMEAGRLARW